MGTCRVRRAGAVLLSELCPFGIAGSLAFDHAREPRRPCPRMTRSRPALGRLARTVEHREAAGSWRVSKPATTSCGPSRRGARGRSRTRGGRLSRCCRDLRVALRFARQTMTRAAREWVLPLGDPLAWLRHRSLGSRPAKRLHGSRVRPSGRSPTLRSTNKESASHVAGSSKKNRPPQRHSECQPRAAR